ncbi:MAG TPA: hypothetical protein RMH99_22825, partial [Sandaracinaceae bacterium LLY-WYZ-13_1]|nr:hypothetical protein [Sandaracinaceae bacterium LLY-WYZ-13_1]
ADAPIGPTRVKAALLLGALDHLRRDETQLARVLERLEPEVAHRVATVMLPMAWIELADYVELLRAAERELGTGDGAMALRIGRATAERELTTTHRLFMQTATPQMAVERIPQLFRTYHSSGRCVVQRGAAGGYRFELRALVPDTLPHAMALAGFYQRLLEMAGGRDVRGSVVSCRERGDEVTAVVLRWR